MQDNEGNTITTPGYRKHYNVNQDLKAVNKVDENENPTGGHVSLDVPSPIDEPFQALYIAWQDGPRRKPDNSLSAPNGAFVEDVLWAALQRLEFFNEGKYRDRANSLAITHIEQALQALKDRQLERTHRGVEGKHEV